MGGDCIGCLLCYFFVFWEGVVLVWGGWWVLVRRGRCRWSVGVCVFVFFFFVLGVHAHGVQCGGGGVGILVVHMVLGRVGTDCRL